MSPFFYLARGLISSTHAYNTCPLEQQQETFGDSNFPNMDIKKTLSETLQQLVLSIDRTLQIVQLAWVLKWLGQASRQPPRIKTTVFPGEPQPHDDRKRVPMGKNWNLMFQKRTGVCCVPIHTVPTISPSKRGKKKQRALKLFACLMEIKWLVLIEARQRFGMLTYEQNKLTRTCCMTDRCNLNSFW